MDELEILRRRLRTQRLAAGSFERPEQVVDWLLAVQGQEYGPAKWALGQRSADCVDSVVEQAFDDGELLRTHVMRPTWHLVRPADIRWLLELTAPRVHARVAPYHRQQELEQPIFDRACDVFVEALRGGKALTKKQLTVLLAEAGIEVSAMQASFLVTHGELEALLCSGPRQGKQQTYALLDERAPERGPSFSRDEALRELALRYFRSHGPATVRDAGWWSGLTLADVRAGLTQVEDQLESTQLGTDVYWHAGLGADGSTADALLLPDYDESFIAYKDLRIQLREPVPEGRTLQRPVVLDGVTVGSWTRKLEPEQVNLEIALFAPLSKRELRAVEQEVAHFERFMEQPVNLQLTR